MDITNVKLVKKRNEWAGFYTYVMDQMEQKILVDSVWVFELNIKNADFYFYLNQRKNDLFPDDKIYYKNDHENYICPFTHQKIAIHPFYQECQYLKPYTEDIFLFILQKSTERLRIRLNHDLTYYSLKEYLKKKKLAKS